MCPVTDIVGAVVEGVEGLFGAGAGAALGAGTADAVGAGVADAALDTLPEITVTAPSLAGAAGGALADAGTTAALAGGAADAALSSTADASASTAGSASAGTGAPSASLPDINVTAPSLAGQAGSTANALGALSSTAGPGIASAAGGGGSGVPGASATASPEGVGNTSAASSAASDSVSDTGIQAANVADAAGDVNPGFLAATNDLSISPLAPTLADQLGIQTPLAGGDFISPTGITDFTGNVTADTGADATDFGVSDASSGFAAGSDAAAGGSGWQQGLEKYLSNPKNDLSLGLLGISAMNALSKPKLPGADTTALNAASAAVPQAESVIQSGGTATAEWTTQKASIDASINQQIQQKTQAIEQAAATNGMGNQNSGIVQQQIAQMTANLNVQRQQLYEQAQQQNVNNAIQELSGSDSVLTSIGNTQLAQSQEARQAAAQTAELALLLQSGTGGGFSQLSQIFGG